MSPTSTLPSGSQNVLLRLESVGYAYDGAQAVANVSMQVNDGEIVALLGSNGAGKTTTAKLIAGALTPKSGELYFREQAVATMPVHRRMREGIVLIPEGRLVFPHMTVHENLLVGAHKETKKARIQEMLHHNYELFPRLKERQTQLAGSMSGGEQQMLAIARGLMSEPKLLILDEPSLGIMPKLVRDIFTLITTIVSEGVSVLLIEQNARASLNIADRAYILEKGRLILEGPAATLAADKFVKEAYLGAAPV